MWTTRNATLHAATRDRDAGRRRVLRHPARPARRRAERHRAAPRSQFPFHQPMRGTLTSAPVPATQRRRRWRQRDPAAASRAEEHASQRSGLIYTTAPRTGTRRQHRLGRRRTCSAASSSRRRGGRPPPQVLPSYETTSGAGRSSVCGAVGRHAACPRVAAIQTRQGAKRRRGAHKSPNLARAGVTRAGSLLDRARVLAQYAFTCHARYAAPDYARLDTRPVRIDKRPAGASGQRRPRRVRGDHHRHDKNRTKKSHDHPRDPA